MVNVQKTIFLKYPGIEKFPFLVRKFLLEFIKKIIYENEINNFLKVNSNMGAFEFIDMVLEYFNFSYKFSSNQIENIPSSGRVIIIANHPLGALDALSLINLIKRVRSDIKVVANDILREIEPLKSIILSVDVFGEKISKETIENIYTALDNEEAVIIFPSGEVSRVRPEGIRDIKWHKGFLKFAIKKSTPILPVYIKAKNSSFFYTMSAINKKFSTIFLPYEMFNKKNKNLEFMIGKIIPFKSFRDRNIDIKTKVKLFRRHLYSIAKNKKEIFATQKCIAHPENRQEIKNELKNSKLLGSTNDDKKIYLFEYKKESAVIKEIAMLREFTFRKVEEGTGKKRDNDEFDEYYKHIVLWDEDALEIVGAYRIGESNFIYGYFGYSGFYTNTLFDFKSSFKPYLKNSIELGRSFVQPKYWGSRALDYLWQGIGAYLYKNPHIRYMFGPVSLSSSIPKSAKNLIIYYYDLYYGSKDSLVKAKRAYTISEKEKKEISSIFCAKNKKENFMILKEQLECYGVNIPVMYKQYSELCEEGGMCLLDFNIDEDFNDCVDGFIIIDIEKIKDKKRKRYIKDTDISLD